MRPAILKRNIVVSGDMRAFQLDELTRAQKAPLPEYGDDVLRVTL